MHERSKGEHSNDEGCANGTCNHEPKGLEESKITKEQAEATPECGDATAENTYSHFSVGLSHFVVSPDMGWMHVVCRKMHNIIDWEPNQNNQRNGLGCAKLQISHVHEGHDADNYYRYAENWNNTLNHVSSCVKKNEEGEENGDNDSL